MLLVVERQFFNLKLVIKGINSRKSSKKLFEFSIQFFYCHIKILRIGQNQFYLLKLIKIFIKFNLYKVLALI